MDTKQQAEKKKIEVKTKLPKINYRCFDFKDAFLVWLKLTLYISIGKTRIPILEIYF